MNKWVELTVYILGIAAVGVVFGSAVFGMIWIIRDYCVANAIRFLQIPSDFAFQLWGMFALAGVITVVWQLAFKNWGRSEGAVTTR